MKGITLIAALLTGIFLAAGAADKVVHWPLFVLALERNPLVPAVMAAAAGGGVIAAESAIALLLVVPRTRRTGMLYAGVLFCLFALVVGALLWLGRQEPCGCSFTFGYDTPTVRHLGLNLLLGALGLYLRRTGNFTSPAVTTHTPVQRREL